VKIYVTGTFEVGAGTNIVAASAADVQIFAHPYALAGQGAPPSETVVKVNGGSNVTWALNAPGALLDIGGGNHFYGAAVGKHIELQGENAFHYDLALGRTTQQGAATLERLYWRELDPPRR
jgi:hypothetical protein